MYTSGEQQRWDATFYRSLHASLTDVENICFTTVTDSWYTLFTQVSYVNSRSHHSLTHKGPAYVGKRLFYGADI